MRFVSALVGRVFVWRGPVPAPQRYFSAPVDVSAFLSGSLPILSSDPRSWHRKWLLYRLAPRPIRFPGLDTRVHAAARCSLYVMSLFAPVHGLRGRAITINAGAHTDYSI